MTDLHEEVERLEYAQKLLHEAAECLEEAAENLSLVELPRNHPIYGVVIDVSGTAHSTNIIYRQLDALVGAVLDLAYDSTLRD